MREAKLLISIRRETSAKLKYSAITMTCTGVEGSAASKIFCVVDDFFESTSSWYILTSSPQHWLIDGHRICGSCGEEHVNWMLSMSFSMRLNGRSLFIGMNRHWALVVFFSSDALAYECWSKVMASQGVIVPNSLLSLTSTGLSRTAWQKFWKVIYWLVLNSFSAYACWEVMPLTMKSVLLP